jgi:hypothetical protein
VSREHGSPTPILVRVARYVHQRPERFLARREVALREHAIDRLTSEILSGDRRV